MLFNIIYVPIVTIILILTFIILVLGQVVFGGLLLPFAPLHITMFIVVAFILSLPALPEALGLIAASVPISYLTGFFAVDKILSLLGILL